MVWADVSERIEIPETPRPASGNLSAERAVLGGFRCL